MIGLLGIGPSLDGGMELSRDWASWDDGCSAIPRCEARLAIGARGWRSSSSSVKSVNGLDMSIRRKCHYGPVYIFFDHYMKPRQKKQDAALHSQEAATRRPIQQRITSKDLDGFSIKIQEQFGWTGPPHTFQYIAIEAQLFRKDVLVHAGTGSGKTAIAAGPHVHWKSRGKVTLLVSPLIALQEEQVETFKTEFKLTAIAVNSSHGGCTTSLMNEICKGKWQIVILSLEMLLSKKFISKVLRNTEMANQILSVVIDEAHVISHWGSGFRKKYGSLGILRALLPKDTLVVAMSATLPPKVRRDILSKLQYGNDYININLGNDRPNVSIVVQAIQNNMNTYSDLDFLIPNGTVDAANIPKTFIYVDNIGVGVEIEDHLYSCCPESIRGLGIIRPYSAAYSAGILICTDAAGMGCNIPDIDVVVQWRLPATVSSFVQRAGRAARAKNRSGLAVLLVEKSVYESDLSKIESGQDLMNGHKKAHQARTEKPPGGRGVHQTASYPKASRGYAIKHGSKRGAYGGQHDAILNPESPEIGMKNLATERVARPFKRGEPNEMVRAILFEWRAMVMARDFSDALFGVSGILKNEMVDLLSSVGPINSVDHLERVLAGRWTWFSTYGRELSERLQALTIPLPQAKSKARSAKRATTEDTGETAGETEINAPKKRTCTHGATTIPTAALQGQPPSQPGLNWTHGYNAAAQPFHLLPSQNYHPQTPTSSNTTPWVSGTPTPPATIGTQTPYLYNRIRKNQIRP
ncbi:P-loop containing nucleoside triphosphate hydrolase protein [Infundibulicybe gibba]|nr:P-loop containing nucleoside triphosphate hydrolase protein [Infundibulicybe gibba]